MNRFSLLVLTVVACAVASHAAPDAENWPSFRGNQASGLGSNRPTPMSWDVASGENVEWKTPIPGLAHSSPIIWKDRIYLSSPDEGDDCMLAFDFNGKEIWRTKLGPAKKPKHKKLGSSCNGSPVTDGEGLFVYFKSGNFAALELDGTLRWKQNLTEEYGAEKLYWDTGTSPVVVGDIVVLARLHGGDSWIAGFAALSPQTTQTSSMFR